MNLASPYCFSLVIASLLFGCHIEAQEARPQHTSEQSSRQQSSVARKNEQNPSEFHEIEFELVKNMIFVNATLNGSEQWFILDSGAPKLVVNRKPDPSKRATSRKGVAGSFATQSQRVAQFSWAGTTMKDADAIVADLSHLEEKLGKKFTGLIGFRELQDYELLIDYKSSILRLFRNGGGKYHNSVQPVATIGFTFDDHLPILSTRIGKKSYALALDTGAGYNLLDQRAFKTLNRTWFDYEGKSDTLVGADAKEIEIRPFRVKSVMLDDTKFTNMLFVASDVSHLQGATRIDGLLGYPFLRQYTISIDFRQQKLNIWPDEP